MLWQDTRMARVLGRLRLSRDTDSSTSIERQRQIIEQWADANGHQIVGWASDVDVSGDTDPFKAPQLGQWLTDEKAGEYDCIAAWKLDRISRNTVKLNGLIGWLLERNLSLISCTEGIDISTPVGRLICSVIGFLAEGELEAIKERTTASRRKLRELGRHTGKTPYGFRAVQLPDGGWTLEHDPETKPTLDRIIAQVLAGKSVQSVATEAGMHPQTVRQLLRSKTLLGHTTHTEHVATCSSQGDRFCRQNCSQGVTVRDSNGEPILKAPPVIDQETFDRLQAVLDSRSFTKKRTDKASPLLFLVKCMKCESNLHHRGQTQGGKQYRYYYCRNCGGRSFKAEMLEKLFEKTYLKQFGDKPRRERVFIPASNHQTELEDAIRALDESIAVLGTITSETAKNRLQSQIEAIDSRIRRLEQMPNEPARYEWRDTDQTHAEAWAATPDADQRKQMLVASGLVGHAAWISGKMAIALEIANPNS